MFENMDDPRKQMLLALAAGLLQPVRNKGAAGFGEALSHGLGAGLMGFNQASQAQRRNRLTDLQEKMAQMQLGAAQRDDAFRQSVGYQPPQDIPYNDSLGSEAPQGPVGATPPKWDLSKAYKIDALKAAELERNLNKQEDPLIIPKDAMAFDRRTRLPVITNRPQEKPVEQWVPVTPEEAAAAGIPKGQAAQRSTLTGKISAIGSLPPNLSVSLPPPEKAILKADEDVLGQLTSSANNSRQFASVANVINSALRGKGGGGMIKLGADTAKFIGLKNELVSANDLAESLNTRLAVTVRAPGSGQTSNLEFEAYKAAAPSLKNSEPGRELMYRAARKFAERDAKLADHARKLIRNGTFSYDALAKYDDGLGSVLGDDLKAISAPSSKVIDFNDLRK